MDEIFDVFLMFGNPGIAAIAGSIALVLCIYLIVSGTGEKNDKKRVLFGTAALFNGFIVIMAVFELSVVVVDFVNSIPTEVLIESRTVIFHVIILCTFVVSVIVLVYNRFHAQNAQTKEIEE